jgi:hypothetical protein
MKAHGNPVCRDNPPFLGPAGNVHCSLEDWGKFARLHTEGNNGHDTATLNAASFKKLHTTPMGSQYTHGGWFKVMKPWAAGYTTLSHEGSNTLNKAIIRITPKRKMSFLAVSNIANREAVKEAMDTLIVGSTAPNRAVCSVM